MSRAMRAYSLVHGWSVLAGGEDAWSTVHDDGSEIGRPSVSATNESMAAS